MKIVIQFGESSWAVPEARHVVGVLASLLDSPYLILPPGAEVPPDSAVVYVGNPTLAPEDCAAVLPVADWPAWRLADLELASLDEGVLPCPRGDAGTAATERDLPGACLRSLGFLLHREEELLDPRRDQWNCYSGFSTRLAAWGVLERPIVNQWAEQLCQRVRVWVARHLRELAETPRWKGGRRFAVALTHDVDWVRRYSVAQSLRLLGQARDPRSYAFRHGLRATVEAMVHLADRSDPYCSFDRWISEEAKHGFRSTFLFCPSHPTPRHEYDPTYLESDRVRYHGGSLTVSGLMRAMVAAECEVGLHGSYQSYIHDEELSRQRQQIERSAGTPIRGVRQHFLRFDLQRTWEAQERAGFQFDTTLGYNEAVGFRAGIGAPFHPWNPVTRSARTLLELPMTLMDGTLFRTLKLSETGAMERIRAHFDTVEQAGGLAVLLWHPNATDESAFPGWWGAYRAALQDLAGRDAWVAPAGEIANWWLERERLMTDPASSD